MDDSILNKVHDIGSLYYNWLYKEKGRVIWRSLVEGLNWIWPIYNLCTDKNLITRADDDEFWSKFNG